MGMLSCLKILLLINIQCKCGFELLLECPVESQWNLRATARCNITKKYFCLFDENKMMNTEFCKEEPIFEVEGYKLVISGNVQGKMCDANRYQPFKFWSNESSQCMYIKSFCNEEGQVGVESIGSSPYSDRVCRCDYTRGYDFIIKPKNQCYCVPAEEDCSCYYRHCRTNLILSPDYRCISLGEWSINFECSIVTSHTQIRNSGTPPYGNVTPLDPSEEGVRYGNTYAAVFVISLTVVYVGTCSTVLLSKKKCSCESQADEIIKWRHALRKFVVTRATNEITKAINSQQCILITGAMGTGKSANAYYAALELKNEGFKIMHVRRPDDVLKYVRRSAKQLFVFDDVMGKYKVNKINVEWFEQNRDTLKNFLNTNHSLKIIMTCRSHIYHASNLQNVVIPYMLCDLQTGDFQLTLNERKKICTTYLMLPYEIPNHVFMLYDFFPSLCNWVGNEERSIFWFEHPIDYLTNEINYLKIREEFAYLALALLVVLNNNVDYAVFDSREDNLLKDLHKESKFNCRSPSNNEFFSTFKSLVGTFVNDTKLVFSFMNEKLFETVSVCVGKYFPLCILQYSSCAFIKDKVQLNVVEINHKNLRIILDSVWTDRFFNRLIRDLNSGYITDVFDNFQLHVPEFNKLLLKNIQKHVKAKSIVDKVDGSTVIHATSAHGYEDLLSYFLSLDQPDINKSDNQKKTALHIACLNKHDKIVELLLKHNANVNQKDMDDRTALHVAIERGNINIVKSLVERRASIFQGDKNKLTPFHLACMNEQPEFVEYLISQKGSFMQSINITDIDGRTPIFIACEMNKLSVVQTLLKYDCNIKKSTITGKRPLQIACENGNDAIVTELCNKKANVNQYTNDGSTPLIIACKSGYDKVVEVLLCTKKAKINKASKTGSTPLYEGCTGGHVNIVEVLLDSGADVNQTANSDDWTPLFISCSKGHTKITALLLQKGADINKSDKNEKTPIYLASANGNFEILNMLRSHKDFENAQK